MCMTSLFVSCTNLGAQKHCIEKAYQSLKIALTKARQRKHDLHFHGFWRNLFREIKLQSFCNTNSLASCLANRDTPVAATLQEIVLVDNNNCRNYYKRDCSEESFYYNFGQNGVCKKGHTIKITVHMSRIHVSEQDRTAARNTHCRKCGTPCPNPPLEGAEGSSAWDRTLQHLNTPNTPPPGMTNVFELFSGLLPKSPWGSYPKSAIDTEIKAKRNNSISELLPGTKPIHAGKNSWGINFFANTCGACICTRVNTGKYF